MRPPPLRPPAGRTAALPALLPAAVLAALLPEVASAQSVVEACYVPGSGTVYRVNAPGAPAACVQPSHVAFRLPAAGDAPAASPAPAAARPAPTAGSARNVAAGGDPQYLPTNGVRESAAGFAVTATTDEHATPVLTTTALNSRALLWHAPRGALRVGAAPPDRPWSAENLGFNSFAYGAGTVASGHASFAGGNRSIASGNSAIALGSSARAAGGDAVALGNWAQAAGHNSFAMGEQAEALATRSVALGASAKATALGAAAIGRYALATGEYAGAAGYVAHASGHSAAAFGRAASATNDRALALGYRAEASGRGSVAVATAYADNGTSSHPARALATGSVAVGHRVVVNGARAVGIGNNIGISSQHPGAFVLNTSTYGDVGATAPEQFVARFAGGYRLFTNASSSTGCAIAGGGGQWACTSDRATKTAFRRVDGDSLLARLRALPITTWRYKSERGARHLGPVAQDFRAAFGLGSDDRSIAVLDASGVALAAAKALEARTRALQAENAALLRRVSRLEGALATAVAVLDAQAPKQRQYAERR